jgi:hypothetical protein
MKKESKYSLEELADAMIFPVALTAAQKKEASMQLAAARKKSRQLMTTGDKVALQLLQLKFQLEDYIESEQFDAAKHFGYFLKQYIDILDIKRKAFAADISVDETMLSQFINMHRTPPDYIAIRLELHSNNIIPADYWYKIVEKEREYEIKTNKELRRKERKFVNKLEVSF